MIQRTLEQMATMLGSEVSGARMAIFRLKAYLQIHDRYRLEVCLSRLSERISMVTAYAEEAYQ